MRAEVCVMYSPVNALGVAPCIVVGIVRGSSFYCRESCRESQRRSTTGTGAWFTVTTRYAVTLPVMSCGQRVQGRNVRPVGPSVGYDAARGCSRRGRVRGYL